MNDREAVSSHTQFKDMTNEELTELVTGHPDKRARVCDVTGQTIYSSDGETNHIVLFMTHEIENTEQTTPDADDPHLLRLSDEYKEETSHVVLIIPHEVVMHLAEMAMVAHVQEGRKN